MSSHHGHGVEELKDASKDERIHERFDGVMK